MFSERGHGRGPGSTGRILRSRAAWVGLAAVTAILLAACGGSDSDDSQGVGGVFDAGGEPMDESEATAAAQVTRSSDAAPDFELVLFGNENHADGEVLRLSDLVGSPVILNFWFPSCPPCRAEMPDLEAAFQRHKADGVRFVGVTNMGLDTARDAKDFIAEIGVTYSLGADTDASIMRAYGVSGFPSTVFLDSEQNLVRKWTGLLNGEKLEELIQEVLN
ncbi:MAG: TlpA family protein disulfide reductase [Chloroflexi bacterium]|nr:TlpA family protein disulfide reductase [Chloroflexota bacterium]